MDTEATQTVEAKPFSMTIKVNAKREYYGEFTVRADTKEELEDNLVYAGEVFHRHTTI